MYASSAGSEVIGALGIGVGLPVRSEQADTTTTIVAAMYVVRLPTRRMVCMAMILRLSRAADFPSCRSRGPLSTTHIVVAGDHCENASRQHRDAAEARGKHAGAAKALEQNEGGQRADPREVHHPHHEQHTHH